MNRWKNIKFHLSYMARFGMYLIAGRVCQSFSCTTAVETFGIGRINLNIFLPTSV
ncbi:MAG TPA: hypothetical protein PLR65_02070 [Anaerolineales bacterium]|nr:hypothetical protein [Anaerolineales bacterium]